MDDVRTVLQKADTQLMAIGTLYGADLELQRTSPTLRSKIRGFLENERAALDQLAQKVVAATASGEAHVHFPLAPWEAGFEASIDKHMPGVREARPQIASTIARHQPFSDPALAQLRELLNDEKRQTLTPQIEAAPVEPEAPAPDPAPEPPPARPAPPPPQGGLGAGLTGPMYINGVEYDPVTLKPLNPPPEPKRDTIFVEWLFTLDAGQVPALRTLEAIRAAVAAAVDEVSAAADLRGPATS